jgi:hypothetical protein
MPVNIFFLLQKIKEPINSLKRMSLKVKKKKLLTRHVSQKHKIIFLIDNTVLKFLFKPHFGPET